MVPDNDYLCCWKKLMGLRFGKVDCVAAVALRVEMNGEHLFVCLTDIRILVWES